MTRYHFYRMSIQKPFLSSPFIIFIPSESLTRFHSRTVPNISVLDYLRRIIKWTKVEVRIHYSILKPIRLTRISEIMPSPHTTLCRPNLRPHAPLHPLLPHLPPLHNRIHHSLQQRPLRLLLHKRPIRPRRRHPRPRTKHPRTRIPSRNRLALNGSHTSLLLPPVFSSHIFAVHPRSPSGILYQSH